MGNRRNLTFVSQPGFMEVSFSAFSFYHRSYGVSTIKKRCEAKSFIMPLPMMRLQKFVFALLFFSLPISSVWAQTLRELTGSKHKVLSPALSARLSTDEFFTVELIASDTAALQKWVKENILGGSLKRHFSLPNLYTLGRLDSLQVRQLAASGMVQALEIWRQPVVESGQSGLDLSLNRVRRLHRDMPEINGKGIVASVKENSFDTADIDFKGRYLDSPNSSVTIAQHAGNMATILGGAGNSGPDGKGVAWGVSLSSDDFSNLFPSGDDYFLTQGVSVQNHSYGTGIENYYGIETQAYDAHCRQFPEILHVFSAGNAGAATPDQGLYQHISGFANLTGQFKMSKNTLSAGATDSLGNVVALSSRGPAYDGRVKPELMAYGQGGSSGAAALVSGIASLMQQAYAQKYLGMLPTSALLKAVLINTARDAGRPEVDFEHGFGNADAQAAITTILEGRFWENSVGQGDTFQASIFIPPHASLLKITLAWSDPPAGISDPKALVNDLDLELVDTANSQLWQPWMLNPFPHPDSLLLPARRSVDTLNNVEQITLLAPLQGTYLIRVLGTKVPIGPQNFSLTWQTDTLGNFQWIAPVKNDFMLPGRGYLLRWESTLAATSGNLSFRKTDGEWQPIATDASLSESNFKWNAPLTPGLYQLRWDLGQQTFVSDTFAVATPLRPKVGFDCPDSIMFFWLYAAGVPAYRIFQLGNQYMEFLKLTNDTFLVLDASHKSTRHYAVAAVIDGITGPMSQTFDFTKQGTGCYLKGFYTQHVEGDKVIFSAEIGTAYGVKALTLEKLQAGAFQPVHTLSPVKGTAFSLEDSPLKQGANFFRLKITLENGGEIFSQTETVYYLEQENYLIFPNPAKAGGPVYLLAKQPQDANFRLTDIQGRVITEGHFREEVMSIPTENLAPGAYGIQVTDEEGNRSGMLLLIN